VVLRSDVEILDEGAAAIMEEGEACSVPVSDAGAAAALGACPVAFTGAESVANELGDCRTL
jgi:hypothetical protein